MHALHEACKAGDVAKAQHFLDAGADKDKAGPGGRTALYLACFKGHEAIVRMLLDAGADKDKAGPDGRTSLHVAGAGLSGCTEGPPKPRSASPLVDAMPMPAS